MPQQLTRDTIKENFDAFIYPDGNRYNLVFYRPPSRRTPRKVKRPPKRLKPRQHQRKPPPKRRLLRLKPQQRQRKPPPKRRLKKKHLLQALNQTRNQNLPITRSLWAVAHLVAPSHLQSTSLGVQHINSPWADYHRQHYPTKKLATSNTTLTQTVHGLVALSLIDRL